MKFTKITKKIKKLFTSNVKKELYYTKADCLLAQAKEKFRHNQY